MTLSYSYVDKYTVIRCTLMNNQLPLHLLHFKPALQNEFCCNGVTDKQEVTSLRVRQAERKVEVQ